MLNPDPIVSAFDTLLDSIETGIRTLVGWLNPTAAAEHAAFDAAVADLLSAMADATPEQHKQFGSAISYGWTAEEATLALTAWANTGITIRP
jgi:hypothetical protein